MKRTKTTLPILNGLSISTVELDQEGNLSVTFDLPIKQRSAHYELSLTGTRTLDVYECKELEELVKKLFGAIRERLLAEPDADLAAVDCDRCRSATCCRSYNVLVTEYDIDRLRGSMSRRSFIEKNTDPAVDWSADFNYQLKCDTDADGEKCVFLKRDRAGRMRCSVYSRRPQICRDFDMAVCEDFTPLGED